MSGKTTFARLLALALPLVLVAGEVAQAAGGDVPTGKLRFIQFLGFGLLFLIIAIYGFPVIARLLRGRSERIAGAFQEVEGAHESAVAERDGAAQALKRLESDRTRVLEEATKEGARLRDALIAEADEASARARVRGRTEAEIERAKTRLACQNDYADAALKVAAEVLERRIDKGVQDALVERFLTDLDELRGKA